MPLPATLDIALKEWATVCNALASGRQMILLRKGGIIESRGKFEIENRQFLLFPTVVHQNLAMLKASEHAGFTPATSEPGQITFAAAGEITDIIQMPSRAAMDRLDDQHIWATPLIDMRFNYKPKNPLYLLLVRAYRLANPVTIENTLTYAGCMSWVPLDKPVSTEGATPAMDDAGYEARRKLILDRIG
jgi:hypothetical protein